MVTSNTLIGRPTPCVKAEFLRYIFVDLHGINCRSQIFDYFLVCTQPNLAFLRELLEALCKFHNEPVTGSNAVVPSSKACDRDQPK